MMPYPLHALATGAFAHVWDPTTGALNVALANQMVKPYLVHPSDTFPGFLPFPVMNGPWVVQSYVLHSSIILARNPRFFSNFFHSPALDQVRLISENPQYLTDAQLPWPQVANALATDYRNGSADIVEGWSITDLPQVDRFPAAQVITSPVPVVNLLLFNQSGAASSAEANGGSSIFTDRNVRQAFVEAFDRCAAVRAQLGTIHCDDPNIFTNELTTSASVDYDSSFKLPTYNPIDAAKLLTNAGYLVVDNIRRAKDGKTPLQIQINLSLFGGGQDMIIAQRMKQDYETNLKVAVHLITNTVEDSNAPYCAPPNYDCHNDIEVYSDQALFVDPVDIATNSLVIGAPDAQDIPTAANPLGGNIGGVIDPYIIQKVKQGQMAPPGPQSDLLFRNLERYVAAQYYAEPLFIVADVTLVKPTICNYKKNPNPFFGDEWNIADWYVAPSCPS
jgi:ABC-type transport system substrate-binding protein